LVAELGVDRALKRCAYERVLSRRARSRQRFEFWTEVARLVAAGAREATPPPADDAAMAERIAGAFAAAAGRPEPPNRKSCAI
jgi:hypothetical protein